MTRTLIFAALLALLSTGLARAQVAAPELTPAAPRYYEADAPGFNGANLTVDNPAALLWNEAALLGFGAITLEQETGGGAKDDYSGYFIGYRGTARDFAFGLEHVTVEQDNGTFNETASSAHVAFMALDGLSLGAGLDLAETDNGSSSTSFEANTFGLSVSLQEKFFLGYAIGRDKFETSAGGTGARDTTLYGVALRVEGGWNWHLAYDHLDKDNYDTGGGGFDSTTLTAQARADTLLLGVQQVEVVPKGGGSTFEALVFDLGWVPDSGLSLIARLSDGEQRSGGTVLGRDSLSVGIGYQW